MFITNYNYMPKRPVDIMNSCRVKNIQILKAIEKSQFPKEKHEHIKRPIRITIKRMHEGKGSLGKRYEE